MPALRRLSIAVFLFLAACNQREPAAPAPRRAQPPAAVAKPASTPAAAAVPAASPCPKRPNILIIVLDTVRADATELDARSRNHTPALRELATHGVNFTRAYSTWDSTPPSHFSILTGYVNGHQTEIDQPEASLPWQLRRLGYRSFGLVANGNLSAKFMRSVMPFGNYTNLQEQWEAMPAEKKAPYLPAIDGLIEHYDSQPNDWYRMFVYSSADEILSRFDAKLQGKRPFLGFINLIDSHDPYFPKPERYDLAKDGPKLEGVRYRTLPPELADPESIADPERKARIKALIAKAQGRAWSVSEGLTKEQLRIYRKRYDAEVRDTDAAVGRIVEMLRKRQLLDDTILVITADHGESFGEGGLLTHSFNNSGDREATNRVNLLIVFPPCYGFRPARIDRSCTIADIAPTLYDLLGVDTKALEEKAPPGNFGRSLLPLLGRESAPSETAATAPSKGSVPEAERKKQDEEALKRFRSLGYLQ